MEKELFMNTGLPPHPPPPGMAMRFEPPSSSTAVMNWSSMSSSMEIQPPELNLVRNPTQDCFFWEKSTEQNTFDSALSSLVSSPTASNSNFSGGGEGGDSFLIRELIGKLGNIGNNSGEIIGTPTNNASCYATPISSPQPRSKLRSPMFVAKTTPLAEFSGDPGFAERAARFSCFGSRSFNGRTNSPFAMNNGAAGSNNIENGSAATVGPNGKLPRVSSSPALKALASHMCKNSPGNEVQCPKVSGELSRKRKSVPKAKPKECSASPSPNFIKGGEGNEESGGKRCKNSEENGKKEDKREEERKGNNTTNKTKPPEPPKDYIHVRARRGQATDSHSLAERVRREKISERMKLLQDLVPGCNKVTGKALMLDEIINYVQSLQRQVEFLSMKLASVNTRLEFNVDALVSKDMIPQNSERVLQLDSTAQAFLRNYHQQNNIQLHPNISSNSTMLQCPIDDHLDTSTLTRSFISHMPPPPPILDQVSDSIPQYSTFCEDDLHSLIQMGFAQNSESQSESIQIQPQNFQSSNQASNT